MSKSTVTQLHQDTTKNVGSSTSKVRVSYLLPADLVAEFRIAMIRRRQVPARWFAEQMKKALKSA